MNNLKSHQSSLTSALSRVTRELVSTVFIMGSGKYLASTLVRV